MSSGDFNSNHFANNELFFLILTLADRIIFKIQLSWPNDYFKPAMQNWKFVGLMWQQ